MSNPKSTSKKERMSLSLLPKELRLQIYTHAYLTSPPRLVALATLPHVQTHREDVYCPRYSPSPAPTLVNLCREAREEVEFQAQRRGDIIHLPSDLKTEEEEEKKHFYFRMQEDILYIPLLEGPAQELATAHYHDDSPDTGLLAHFLQHATSVSGPSCDATQLRNIAVSKVIPHGFRDGSLSNVLRLFPHIAQLIMMVPEPIYHDKTGKDKEVFVRAAARIVRMYKLDLMAKAREEGRDYRVRGFEVDFGVERGGGVGGNAEQSNEGKGEEGVEAEGKRATTVKWGLELIDRDLWREWSDGGDEWATLDPRVDPFW